MGGNAIAKVNNIIIGNSKPINLLLINKDILRSILIELFNSLNDLYYNKYNKYLWTSSIINYLNGSSKYFFTEDSFECYKPILGDIDIMISDHDIDNLFQLLKEVEQSYITKTVKYLGQGKDFRFGQINAVFQFKHLDIDFFPQIDFEPCEFVRGLPTEFAKFSHSSSWEDIKNGFKGFHHKCLLTNIVRTFSEIKEDVVVVTKRSTPNKISLSTSSRDVNPKLKAFSVVRGLRNKYKFENFLYNGKKCIKRLETDESEYITDPKKMYKELFCKTKYSSKFESFIGLVDLLQRSCEQEVNERIVMNVFESCYGEGAQVLAGDDLTEDLRIKQKMLVYLCDQFKITYDNEKEMKYYDQKRS